MPTNPFEPWKPVWSCLRAAAVCTVVFAIASAAILMAQGKGPPLVAVIVGGSLFLSFFGMAGCFFAAIVSAWMGALARCPKCGERFAGRYFATQCRACGFTPRHDRESV